MGLIYLLLVSVRDCVNPQDRSAAGRIMSMINSNDTIGNRARNLPSCSAVPQPTSPPAACPEFQVNTKKKTGLPSDIPVAKSLCFLSRNLRRGGLGAFFCFGYRTARSADYELWVGSALAFACGQHSTERRFICNYTNPPTMTMP